MGLTAEVAYLAALDVVRKPPAGGHQAITRSPLRGEGLRAISARYAGGLLPGSAGSGAFGAGGFA